MIRRRTLLTLLLTVYLPAAPVFGQPLPFAATGDLYAHSLTLASYDVADPGAVVLKRLAEWGTAQMIPGEGLAFDADGNLYVGVQGIDVYDPDLIRIGHAAVADGYSQRAMMLAFRRPGQLFACNPVRKPPELFARLFVFDTSDPYAPRHTNTVNIPFTTDFGGSECRGIAFDGSDHLWVTAFVQLIKLTLDAEGTPTAAERFFPGANPFAVAFEPATGRLFYSAVNQNYLGVAHPSDPGGRVATIAGVCDNANNSPTTLAFNSAGDLFVGCSNHDGATADIVFLPASGLAGLAGNVAAAALGAVRIERPELPHGGHLAFQPLLADVTPPPISAVSATPASLDVSNHKLVDVALSYSVTDDREGTVSCALSVTSNQPVDGPGDGSTGSDWEITGPTTLRLRAERSGSGGDRVYTVLVTCTDQAGNSSQESVEIIVPHDRRGR